MGRCSLTHDRRGKVPKPRKHKDPRSEPAAGARGGGGMGATAQGLETSRTWGAAQRSRRALARLNRHRGRGAQLRGHRCLRTRDEAG